MPARTGTRKPKLVACATPSERTASSQRRKATTRGRSVERTTIAQVVGLRARVVLPEHVGQGVRENQGGAAAEGRELGAERREKPAGAGGRHVVDGPRGGRSETHEVPRRAAEVRPRAEATKRATPLQARSDPAPASFDMRSQPRRTTSSIAMSGETEFRRAAEKLLVESKPERVEPLVQADAGESEDDCEAASAGRRHEPLPPGERLDEEERRRQDHRETAIP